MTRAFSKERLLRRSRGLMSFSMHVFIASAAFTHSRIFAGEVAGVDDEPVSVRPIDSIAVAIVFAVYIPPQAPAPGHACCSMSSIISSLVFVWSPPSLGCFKLLYTYAPEAS